MKHIFISVMLCFCCMLGACSLRSGGTATGSADMDQDLFLPRTSDTAYVFVEEENCEDIPMDLKGLVMALLQSERDMYIADDEEDADYVITLTVENFEQTGATDAPVDVEGTALLGLTGMVAGASVGEAINGGRGAAWGAGIGTLAGVGFGLLRNAGEERTMWDMVVTVQIYDADGKYHVREIIASTEDQGMTREDAALSLENEVAWKVVDMFE